MGFTRIDVAELEGEGPGGAVKKVRRALGARAFGFNYITLPAGVAGHEHDHAEEGQEEVYVVVRGSGRIKVEDEVVELEEWDAIRIGEDTMRNVEAGPDGIEFLAFGAGEDAQEVEMVPHWWEDAG